MLSSANSGWIVFTVLVLAALGFFAKKSRTRGAAPSAIIAGLITLASGLITVGLALAHLVLVLIVAFGRSPFVYDFPAVLAGTPRGRASRIRARARARCTRCRARRRSAHETRPEFRAGAAAGQRTARATPGVRGVVCRARRRLPRCGVRALAEDRARTSVEVVTVDAACSAARLRWAGRSRLDGCPSGVAVELGVQKLGQTRR